VRPGSRYSLRRQHRPFASRGPGQLRTPRPTSAPLANGSRPCPGRTPGRRRLPPQPITGRRRTGLPTSLSRPSPSLPSPGPRLGRAGSLVPPSRASGRSGRRRLRPGATGSGPSRSPLERVITRPMPHPGLPTPLRPLPSLLRLRLLPGGPAIPHSRMRGWRPAGGSQPVRRRTSRSRALGPGRAAKPPRLGREPSGGRWSPPPGRTLRRRRPSSGRGPPRRRRSGRGRRARRPGRPATPPTPGPRVAMPTAPARGPGNNPLVLRPARRPADPAGTPLPLPAATLGLGEPLSVPKPSSPRSRGQPGGRQPCPRTSRDPPSGPPNGPGPSRPMPMPTWTHRRPGRRSCSPEGACSAMSTRRLPRRCRHRRHGIRWRFRELRGRSGGRFRGPRFGGPDRGTGVTAPMAGPGGGSPGRRPLSKRRPHRPERGGGGLGWWRCC
jgi:hypothetical protein